MADEKLAKLLESQISLTEWLKSVNGKEAAALYEEDNDKASRLAVLHKLIGLPYSESTHFEAQALKDRTPELKQFLQEHGQELCRLRLTPKPGKGHMPRLRMRGKTINDTMAWFDQQNISHQDYLADFVPHIEDYSWATIFVVNKHGIFGEINYGGHHILTQGFHEQKPPMTFAFDFKDWTLEPHNDDALKHLKELVGLIHVNDPAQQEKVAQDVEGKFTHDYLEGYFETTHSQSGITWFIDYNRILGNQYSDFVIKEQRSDTGQSLVGGRTASPGKVTAPVAVVLSTAETEFNEGDVLVCPMTSPDYLPLMKKASAIVTDQGGILCHAAIVARELKKPCIVGTGNATQVLQNGHSVIVDADSGIVTEA